MNKTSETVEEPSTKHLLKTVEVMTNKETVTDQRELRRQGNERWHPAWDLGAERGH